MRRLLFASGLLASLFVALLTAAPAAAQLTTVTGTVNDPNNIPYAGATLKAQLTLAGSNVTGQPTVTISSQAQCISAGMGNAPCQVPFSGTMGPITLDPTGSFTLNLQDNSLITPAATQWTFSVTISPGQLPPLGFGPRSFSGAFTISGASQSLSVSLSALAPVLTRLGTGTGIGVGGGSVTSVSSGNLPPVFTSVTNTPSTTPSIVYTLSNAAPNTVFGNCTAGALPPTYCALTSTMLPAGTGTVTTLTTTETGMDPLETYTVTNPGSTPNINFAANTVQPGLFLRGPISTSSTTNPTFENAGVNSSSSNGTTVTISAAPAAATTAAIFFGLTGSGQNVPSPDGTWTNFPAGGGTISGSLPRFKNISSSAKLTASSTIGVSDSWSDSLAFLGGTITAVGNATAFTNGGTGIASATMGAVGAGHSIVIYGSWASATLIPNDVRATDNVGNLYFRMLFAPNLGSNGHFALIAQNVPAGTPTITLNTSVQINFGSTIAFELTGPTAYYSGINGPWQFGPLTLTDLATAGAQTVQTFVNKNLAGSVAITLNTLTTIDSVTVTIPASGGPWRARVTYNYYKSGGLQFNCYVTDGTNLFAGYDMQTTGSANVQGCNSGQLSPVTYAPGTSQTFTVKIFDVGNSTITTTSNVHTPSGVSSMQVELVSSN